MDARSDNNGVFEWLDDAGTTVNKRKQYASDDLEKAIDSVKRLEVSISEASRIYGVPRKTISNRLKSEKEDKILKKRGVEKVLTDDEEYQIVDWLLESAKNGDTKSKDNLCQMAANIRNLRSSDSSPNFKPEGPTDNWVKCFLVRHPYVTIMNNVYSNRRVGIKKHIKEISTVEGTQNSPQIKRPKLLKKLDPPSVFVKTEVDSDGDFKNEHSEVESDDIFAPTNYSVLPISESSDLKTRLFRMKEDNEFLMGYYSRNDDEKSLFQVKVMQREIFSLISNHEFNEQPEKLSTSTNSNMKYVNK